MKKKIYHDFINGLTALGLARKYGKTVFQIENILRRQMK